MVRRNKRSEYLADKYASCVRVQYGNRWVRKLSPAEIDEFKAGIQRIIDPSIRVRAIVRRSVV